MGERAREKENKGRKIFQFSHSSDTTQGMKNVADIDGYRRDCKRLYKTVFLYVVVLFVEYFLSHLNDLNFNSNNRP